MQTLYLNLCMALQGAVVGLAALGPHVARLLLLSHVIAQREPSFQTLTPVHGPAGAVVGLAALGSRVVRLLLLPHVAAPCTLHHKPQPYAWFCRRGGGPGGAGAARGAPAAAAACGCALNP